MLGGERNQTSQRRSISALVHRAAAIQATMGLVQSILSSGLSGIAYTAAFARDGKAVVNMDISRGNEEWNRELLDGLATRKHDFQSEFQEEIQWDQIDGRRACYVRIARDGSIDDDEATLEELHDWMVDRLLAFKRVFDPHLRELAR